MNKEKIYKFLYFVSALLIIGFGIRVGVDAYQYSAAINSAPFYVFVLARSAEFILPAAICFVIGIVMNKKQTKNKSHRRRPNGFT